MLFRSGLIDQNINYDTGTGVNAKIFISMEGEKSRESVYSSASMLYPGASMRQRWKWHDREGGTLG